MVTSKYHTLNESMSRLGESLRQVRLQQNLDQKSLASQAGVSVGAVKNLESGSGASLKTLVSVSRVLKLEQGLLNMAPIPTINPLNMTKKAQPRERAGRKFTGQKPHGN